MSCGWFGVGDVYLLIVSKVFKVVIGNFECGYCVWVWGCVDWYFFCCWFVSVSVMELWCLEVILLFGFIVVLFWFEEFLVLVFGRVVVLIFGFFGVCGGFFVC